VADLTTIALAALTVVVIVGGALVGASIHGLRRDLDETRAQQDELRDGLGTHTRQLLGLTEHLVEVRDWAGRAVKDVLGVLNPGENDVTATAEIPIGTGPATTPAATAIDREHAEFVHRELGGTTFRFRAPITSEDHR